MSYKKVLKLVAKIGKITNESDCDAEELVLALEYAKIHLIRKMIKMEEEKQEQTK